MILLAPFCIQERIREIQEIVASHCLQNALLLRLGTEKGTSCVAFQKILQEGRFRSESEATLLGVISDELISLRGNVEGMKTSRELLFLYLFCI